MQASGVRALQGELGAPKADDRTLELHWLGTL